MPNETTIHINYDPLTGQFSLNGKLLAEMSTEGEKLSETPLPLSGVCPRCGWLNVDIPVKDKGFIALGHNWAYNVTSVRYFDPVTNQNKQTGLCEKCGLRFDYLIYKSFSDRGIAIRVIGETFKQSEKEMEL